MDEDICIICYDSLDIQTTYLFLECHHKFCFECISEIILSASVKEILCPVDRRIIKNIQYYNSTQNIIATKSTFIFVKESFEKWSPKFRDCISDVTNEMISALSNLELLDVNLSNKQSWNTDDTLISLREQIHNHIDVKEIEALSQEKKVPMDKYIHFFNNTKRSDKKIQFLITFFNYVRISDIVNNFIEISEIIKENLNAIINLITMKLKLKNIDLIEECYTEIYRNNSMSLECLRSIIVEVKAALTEIRGHNGLIHIFKDSKEHCIICERNLSSHNFIQFEECCHSICSFCINSYTIVTPQCVFQCTSYNQRYICSQSFSNPVEIKTMDYHVEHFEKQFISDINLSLSILIKQYQLITESYRDARENIRTVLSRFYNSEIGINKTIECIMNYVHLMLQRLQNNIDLFMSLSEIDERKLKLQFKKEIFDGIYKTFGLHYSKIMMNYFSTYLTIYDHTLELLEDLKNIDIKSPNIDDCDMVTKTTLDVKLKDFFRKCKNQTLEVLRRRKYLQKLHYFDFKTKTDTLLEVMENCINALSLTFPDNYDYI